MKHKNTKSEIEERKYESKKAKKVYILLKQYFSSNRYIEILNCLLGSTYTNENMLKQHLSDWLTGRMNDRFLLSKQLIPLKIIMDHNTHGGKLNG